MSESAKSIIVDAFEDIVVLTSESPLQATDAQTAIRALNRLMASLAASGINIGYTEVTNLNSPITVPDGATDAIVALLAMRLWPKYRTPELSTSVVINAREARQVLARIAVLDTTADMPATLPVGSGNEYVDSDRFYTDSEESVLTETDAFISVESDTVEDIYDD